MPSSAKKPAVSDYSYLMADGRSREFIWGKNEVLISMLFASLHTAYRKCIVTQWNWHCPRSGSIKLVVWLYWLKASERIEFKLSYPVVAYRCLHKTAHRSSLRHSTSRLLSRLVSVFAPLRHHRKSSDAPVFQLSVIGRCFHDRNTLPQNVTSTTSLTVFFGIVWRRILVSQGRIQEFAKGGRSLPFPSSPFFSPFPPPSPPLRSIGPLKPARGSRERCNMAVSNVVSPSLKGGGRSRLGPPLNPPLYLFNRFCGYSVNAVNIIPIRQFLWRLAIL